MAFVKWVTSAPLAGGQRVRKTVPEIQSLFQQCALMADVLVQLEKDVRISADTRNALRDRFIAGSPHPRSLVLVPSAGGGFVS